MAKSALDKDLKRVVQIETATNDLARKLATPGLLVVFAIGAVTVASLSLAPGPLLWFVLFATVIAAYMAINIGANDVANNMGPAVGSRALSMAGALAIAAVCEATGAILAGGDVVNTISRDLISPDAAMDAVSFTLVMMAALLAAAMWIHLATFLGAPVSTTHAVVGGVVGAGAMAFGPGMVSWDIIGVIVASWITSPLIGGVLAALHLAFIKWAILYREDRIAAAQTWVPILVGLMIGVFAAYLAKKGLSHVWKPSSAMLGVIGVSSFASGWIVVRFWISKRLHRLENRRKSIAGLFSFPLVVAAALLSFAHGANDVANAVGPLAAIVATSQSGAIAGDNVALPVWVLAIGAVGISLGLALFGPRLIRTVGEKITKMDAIRAYCVAFSAALTVLVASALGLPVSSTHIAVGAVFGVGFLREYITNSRLPNPAVQPSTRYLKMDRLNDTPEKALQHFQKRERRRLVRRQHVLGIAAAWVVTVPATALLAALFYLIMGAVAGSGS